MPPCLRNLRYELKNRSKRLVDAGGREDVHPLQVLELARHADERREVTDGALVVDASVERGVEDRVVRLELEELVDEPRECVVGRFGEARVRLTGRPDPAPQGFCVLFGEVGVRVLDAPHVVPKQLLVYEVEVEPLDAAHVTREQQEQNADGEPDLVAAEERVRAWGVDVDAALLEPLGEVAGVAVLHRPEQEGDLVVVVDAA